MATAKIKKRYSLPDDVIRHIFEGDADGNDFAGFHSEVVKSFENGNVQHVTIPGDELLKRNANKPYKAYVRVKIGGAFKGPTVGREKSFFPKNWKKDDIVRWIEQALTDPGDKCRSSHQDWLDNPRQIRSTGVVGQVLDTIRVNKVTCSILYEGGEIASVFPKIAYTI